MKIKFGLAALAATALVAAGCGGDDNKESTSVADNAGQQETMTDHSSMSKTSGKGGVDSGSSELRSTLTAGLQEHVYLAGIAVANGVNHGLDSGQFKAAAGTLDKNSVALSKAIGSIYGGDAETAFLKTWRDHIGFFVDYTKGKATKDAALVKKANDGFDGYRAEFGALLAKVNPNLTAEAVSNDLKGHIATLQAAIDSVVAGKADAFDQLQNAAAHMPGTADVLAGAISKQYPDKFSGSSTSGASKLRADQTAGLQEHVYLAGIAVQMGVEKGLDSGEFKAAAATLDKNTVALSKPIAALYGADAGKAFLKTWRDHIGFFVDYTKGKATKDAALVKQANAGLDGYRAEFGAFLAKANPNLTAEAVSSDLKGHIATLQAAIDSVVAGKADAFDQLRNAAAHMPGTAQVLAGAIAKQFPDKFPE